MDENIIVWISFTKDPKLENVQVHKYVYIGT